MPLWARGFVNVVRAFKIGHVIDRIIEDNIAAEAREAENNVEA